MFPVGKGDRCVRLTTLPPSCAVVMKSGNLNFLEPSRPLRACNGTALPFLPVQTIVKYGKRERPVKDFYEKPHLRPRTQVVDFRIVLTSVFHRIGGRGLDKVIG
jgi:hypothetical protein